MPVSKVSVLKRVDCNPKYIMVMENTFPVKIQTNVNQRKHIHNFLPEVSHTIKVQNFDHQNWSKEAIFLCQAEQVLIFLGIYYK